MLLGFGIACALVVLVSYRPPLRPGTIGFLAFFPSWLTSELPLHAAAFMTSGALILTLVEGFVPVGTALVALSVVALLGHYQMASKARAVVDGAVGGAGQPASFRRLAMVLPLAPPDLEHIKNLPYLDGARPRQSLDVWRQKGLAPGARRPALLFIHGGGWVIGNKELQGLVTVHELARAGWVCFSTNYRLSPGAVWPDHLDDVKQALAWIRAHADEYGADPGLVVVSGASAGGHLASLVALSTAGDPRLRVQGCITYYGVYDLTPPWPNRAFGNLLLEKVVFQRRHADHPQDYVDASPIRQISADAPPFLIFHGERDSLVPVAMARRFAERLREVSRAKVVYAELEGAQHAFELFHTRRSHAAVEGTRRFCAELAEARR